VETTSSNRVAQVFNDLNKKDHHLEQKQIPEKVDLKIKNLAEDKLVLRHFGKIYDHLISNASSNTILRLFSSLLGKPSGIQIYEDKYTKTASFKEPIDDNAPIGIKGPNWVNALMQFIIHIPNISHIFDFTPRSFLPFNLFIDSYEYDRSHKHQVSLNSEILLECLYKKFHEKFFLKYRGKIDLYSILNLIMGSIFDEDIFSFDVNQKHINLLAFHPEWQIIVEAKEEIDFESYIARALSILDLPKEMLISYSWIRNGKRKKISKKLKPKKNVFLKNSFYQLDAFIEYREDEMFSGSYITYLKIDKIWYQCEDAKIKKVHINHLCVAMQRSILLHYKLIHRKLNKIN